MSNSESTSPNTIKQNSEIEVSTLEVTDNSMGEFYRLRNNLFLGTIVIALIGSSLSWWFYSWQTSMNYLIGTGFGLVYLNMLVREVERIGPQKKSFGKTRLAMFVGLIIVAIKIQQLEVLPIFIGFMTYKVAIVFYILPQSLFEQSK